MFRKIVNNKKDKLTNKLDSLNDRWKDRKKSITETEIKEIQNYADKIEAIINLQVESLSGNGGNRSFGKKSHGKDEIIKELESTFEVWKDIPKLRKENEPAEIVLEAVYQQGKIKSCVENIIRFTEQIEQLSTEEKVREKGYNNYISNLQYLVNHMKRKYSEKKMELEKEEIGDIKKTPENVIWFLKSECAATTSIRELPDIYEAVLRLKKCQKGDLKTPENEQDKSKITMWLELWEEDNHKEEELKSIRRNLSQRVEKMRENITKGQEMYEWITELLTEEWFEQFDPESENSEVLRKTKEELRLFYLKKMESVRDKLQMNEGGNVS